MEELKTTLSGKAATDGQPETALVHDLIVIGSGMAGLTLAHFAALNGQSCLVIEKSHGIGGRLATRATPFGAIDHGAQYFSVRSPAFANFVPALNAAPWSPAGKDRAGVWHVGRAGMRHLLAPLATPLNITFGAQAKSIARAAGHWTVQVAGGDENRAVDARRVVVAVPAPQALRLLAPVDPAFSALERAAYAPCWAGIFAFARQPDHRVERHRGAPGDGIGWIADMSSRPGLEDGSSRLIVHMTPQWSHDMLELPADDVLAGIENAMAAIIGPLPERTHARAHRWRHALVTEPVGQPFLANDDMSLAAIGDGMLAGRVEAAFLSAHALAQRLGWA